MTTERRLAIAGAGAVAGCILGSAAALLQASGYRATTTLLVQVHGAPAAVPTIAAIATGDSVVGNVANSLHGSANAIRRHLHVSEPPRTALVRLAYDDKRRLRALQVVQEEATVLQAIVSSRLGGSVRVSVVDPARAKGRNRPVVRDALIGGLLGLLLGALAAVAVRPPRSRTHPPTESARAAPPTPSPEPPAPAVVPPPVVVPQARSGRVAELRALVEAHGAAYSADQLAEWHGYLEAFATQEADGELPPNLEGLARDVFAPLLERA